MTIVNYSVPNISCGHCVHTIKTELADLSGVKSMNASAETKIVEVEYESPASEEKIKNLLVAINYPAAS